jgi:integrase/recombinase XerD
MDIYSNAAYRSTHLAAIKKYYDYLLYCGKRSYHPCRNLKVRNASKPLQFQDLLTHEEMQLLLSRENRYKHLENRNKCILSLLIYQGLRMEEIVLLKTNDIDWDKGIITIAGTRSTSGRRFELRAAQMLYFDRYIRLEREHLLDGKYAALFITNRGVPISGESIGSIIEPVSAFVPYKTVNAKHIRMSVISYWLNEQHIPLDVVQLMAGHKFPSSTERYLKPNSDDDRSLIKQYHPLG